MSASPSTIAPALLLCQPDELNGVHEYPDPEPLDEDDPPYTLVTDDSMSLTDVRRFFATRQSEHANSQVSRPFQPPRRFTIVTNEIMEGAVVAVKWSDGEYYPARVLRRCSRNTFGVCFLADGIDYIAHRRCIHLNPKFGMCTRDERVWATGLVKTFDKQQYRF
jgi:hypothetical protein